MIRPLLARSSVDDYLGNAEQRFFSSGYRRVRYDFDGIHVRVAGRHNGTLDTRVSLCYPTDWSRKSTDATLRPHLSTVDAILLAAELSELYLVAAYRLDGAARRRMWLRSTTIRAGARPEEDLDRVAIKLSVVEAQPGSRGTLVSVLDVRIAAMRIRCEVEHDGLEPTQGATSYRTLELALGPADQRLYGGSFRFRTHQIDNLTVDIAALTATGQVRTTDEHPARDGLEAHYQPAPTFLDCFVTSLQLGQVLLYELDSTPRGSSNTLWMRTTDLAAVTPRRVLAPVMSLRATLAATRIVEMGGVGWRTADIAAELGGVRLRCSVAHALPDLRNI